MKKAKMVTSKKVAAKKAAPKKARVKTNVGRQASTRGSKNISESFDGAGSLNPSKVVVRPKKP